MKHKDTDWSSVTWEGAEKANLRDGMQLSFAQKLRWLEEMQALADASKRPAHVREDGTK